MTKRRSMEVPPRKGRMGGVFSAIESAGGMTRVEIEDLCVQHGLNGGSIERMLFYAKQAKLLKADWSPLFDDEQPVPQPAPLIPQMPKAINGHEDAKMKPESLCFLNDPMARQLAVAWQACHGDEAVWLAAAGIRNYSLGDARQLCAALRYNHICRDGGVTDPLALQYIATLVAEPLLKQKGKAKP